MPQKDAANPPAPPTLIFVLFFAAALLINAAVPIRMLPPGWNHIPAFLLSLGGLGIFTAAALAFRRSRTPLSPYEPARTLMTTGPYLRTRNPVYLSYAWIYLGLACATASAWPFLLFPILVYAINRHVIAREEAHLEKRFGAAYRDYKSRVRRWM